MVFEITIWFVAFFWTAAGALGYIIADMHMINKLKKTGKFVSRSGTYTFTPKEKTTNE